MADDRVDFRRALAWLVAEAVDVAVVDGVVVWLNTSASSSIRASMVL